MFALLVLPLVLLLSACGPSEPTASPGDLFREYVNSTTVKNDRFRGATSADRLAQFAAEGTPEMALAKLLSATQCGECGYNATHRRTILVKHSDGQLELVTMYLADNQLIDPKGKRHSSLEDFHENNEVFEEDDQILVPKNITAVPGDGEVVVISGRASSAWDQWQLWVLGGGSLGVVVLFAVLLFRRRGRRAR